MNINLFTQAISKFILGVTLIGLLIFIPAGTIHFLNGWLLMGILFVSMPLVLGSLYAFVIFLAYPFIIAKRIKGEESFLEKELDGYTEYKEKVRFRLIPFVW